MYTQKVDPTRFITNIYRLGWKIIYLKRDDIFAQSISRLLSGITNRWHAYKYKDITTGRYTIDPHELIQQLEFRKNMCKEQENSLRFAKYITLTYENDLLNTQDHQNTMDNIFNYLDLLPKPVKTKYLKSTPILLKDIIINYNDLLNTVNESGLKKVILKHNPRSQHILTTPPSN